MRPFILAVVLAGLTACAAQQQAQVADKCRGYGYSPGTEAWKQCAMQVDMAIEAQKQASARQSLGIGLYLLTVP